MKPYGKYQAGSVLLAIPILCLLLCAACATAATPLSQRTLTTAELFHEDGVYPFLPTQSGEQAFVDAFGVTREEINDATEQRWRYQPFERNPAFEFQFESVPAMVSYQGNGTGVLLEFEHTEPARLVAATEAILDALEAQCGRRPQLTLRSEPLEWNGYRLRVGYQTLEDGQTKVVSSLTIYNP